MPDKSDIILERLNNHIEQQTKFEGRIEPIFEQVIEHEIWIKEYKEKQMPRCGKKFDRLFSLVWWVLGVFLVASLGLAGTLIAKMVSK